MTDEKHKSRTARTFDLLRDAIVDADFTPGQKLHIDQLGKRLDASIGAVREALSRLTAEGLVVAMPQKGFHVAPVSRKDLLDLTEVRVQIECTCLRQSIAHGDLGWEGRVLSLQHQLRALDRAWEKAGTPEFQQWHILHGQFHDALTDACPNDWWLRLRDQLFMQSERYRRLSRGASEATRDVTAEHNTIAEAALSRDADTATRMMETHLRGTAELLLKQSRLFDETDSQS